MMNAILKSNAIKSTPIREYILELFHHHDELSIKDIKALCERIDISTIYRTLELFEKKNLIIKIVSEGNIVYSLKSNHSHYLNCIKCHKKIRIDTCPFDDNNYKGFKILNHTLFIEGICSNCQKDYKC